jgi:Holliday junction DNA helicase RuvA
MELKDRIGDLGGSAAVAVAGATPAGADDPLADAVSALIALGYKPAEANRMARAVAGGDGSSSEAIIRAALKAVNQV